MNNKTQGALILVVIIASILAVTVYLTDEPAQQQSVGTITGEPLPSAGTTILIKSVKAFQDPNNSSQVSALAIIVQPSGIGPTNFTCGQMTISLTTPTASYTNVYAASDFVNASTFNNAYGGSFTNYQTVASNCSIIELQGNGTQILEQGEQFAVFINLNSIHLDCPLQPNAPFAVELIPSTPVKVTFTDNIPANITPVMLLSGS